MSVANAEQKIQVIVNGADGMIDKCPDCGSANLRDHKYLAGVKICNEKGCHCIFRPEAFRNKVAPIGANRT